MLKLLAPENRIVIPDTVDRELRTGTPARPWLAQVLDQPWIERLTVDEPQELAAYAAYARLLVGDDERNTGECGVLALAEVHGFIAIIDDRAACRAAERKKVLVHRTLKVLFEAINQGFLTRAAVSAIADDLNRTKYRLPVRPGEAVQWGIDQGLIAPE